MTVPVEWNGAGLDYVSLVLALEEIAAGDGAISTINEVFRTRCLIGITLGNMELMSRKKKYLKEIGGKVNGLGVFA